MERKNPVVKVYSTPTCPYCTIAKNFLREKGVKFADIDVSVNKAAAAEMVQKSGQMGVPVIDIDGKLIVGFNREAIKKSLNLT